ncbi:MAG: MATE family efflux transporter, partial [Sulfolobales archaeon]|nr:MATE family efflux transporter [Sulfolobales archaeon]
TVPRLIRPTYMLFEAIFIALGAANLAMMSQYIGSGRFEEASKTFNQFLTISILLGSALTFVYLVVNEYMLKYVVRAPLELLEEAVGYSSVIAFDILLNGVTTSFSTAFNAIGETRIPAAAGIASAILNFLLDPALIVGFWVVPALGSVGAALATVVSRAVKLAVLATLFTKRFSSVELRFAKKIERRWIDVAVKTGGPMFIRHSLNSFGIMIQYSIVNSFGVVATASYTIGFLFMDVVEAFVRGSTTPIAVIVGQNIGAGNFSRAKSAAMKISALLSGVTAATSALLLLLGENLARVFTSDPSILSESMEFLRIFLPTLPFLTIFFIGLSIGRGSGHTLVPTAITLLRMWGFRILCAYLTSLVLGMGTGGLWLSISLGNVIGGLVSALWIGAGKWCRPIV